MLYLLMFFPDFCPYVDRAPCIETSIEKQRLYAAIWEAWHLEVKAVASSSSHIWPLCSIGFQIVYREVGKHNVWFPDLEKGRHRKLRHTVSRDRGGIQVLCLLFLCSNYSILSQVGGECGEFLEHFTSSVKLKALVCHVHRNLAKGRVSIPETTSRNRHIKVI